MKRLLLWLVILGLGVIVVLVTKSIGTDSMDGLIKFTPIYIGLVLIVLGLGSIVLTG